MTPTARILTLSLCLAGCAPALRFPGDWDASPDASEARADASRADAADSSRDARSDASDARVNRAEVLSVDVPGADVVVMGGDSAVVWITDAPDASDAGTEAASDVPAVDVHAPVDAPDVLPPCGALEARCAGACVPLLTTAAHCGACGRACPSPANGIGVCNGGRCEVACSEGFADCGRGCQSVESDHDNCGACGQVCGTRETCVAGNCAECATGESVCGGACVDVTRDAAHCGACSRACPSRSACQSGRCESVGCGTPRPRMTWVVGTCDPVCLRGWGDCDGDRANGCETDVSSDRANCGGCRVACGTRCEASMCW